MGDYKQSWERQVLGSWYFPVALTAIGYITTRFGWLTGLGDAGFWWQVGWLAACWTLALWLWMILGAWLCIGCSGMLPMDGKGDDP